MLKKKYFLNVELKVQNKEIKVIDSILTYFKTKRCFYFCLKTSFALTLSMKQETICHHLKYIISAFQSKVLVFVK